MSTATGSWIGTTLADGRYHVTRVLGEGGMGVAYLAWDHRLETEVVLKVPHRHLLTSAEVVQRFEREIRSLVALSHPHVVRVTDVAKHDGVPYTVLQYLSGGSLDDRLRQLPPHASLWQRCELLLSWIEAIAKALDFVHGHGCVHRDVKPANILFDKHGNAYLADFGVAKTIADQQNAKQATALTGQGMVLGTPDYMAPELITANQFDGRVDQYALAITVFEALAGRLPLTAPSPTAMLVAHATQRPMHLVEVLPELPKELAVAVARGMAKNPAERHANCHAFALAVVTSLRDAPRATLEAVQVTSQTVQEPARLACPACKAVLIVKPDLRGKRVPCNKCRTPLWVAPDLQRLELATSAAGATTPVATHAPVPPPTLPVGTMPIRTRPAPPPLARPVSVAIPLARVAAEAEPAGWSIESWVAIGSLTGLAALAVLYFGLVAGSDAPASPRAPSDTQVAVVATPPDNSVDIAKSNGFFNSVVDSENSGGFASSAPATAPMPVAPSVIAPQPASTNTLIAKPVQLKSSITSPPKVDNAQPDGATGQTPIDAPKPRLSSDVSAEEPSSQPLKSPTPMPPSTQPSVTPEPPATGPVVVKLQSPGSLAKLPKQFALPELVTGEKQRAVKLGAITLKADETLALKLLTEVAGVKAKKPTTVPAMPGLPTKKEYRFELSKASQPSRWSVVAKLLTPPGDKNEPDVPVGEFFVADEQLQFQWNEKLDETVANPLRSAVLVASVGSTEHPIALRDVVRKPSLTVDLGQKITTVKLDGVKGLPPKEAVWLEVLDAQGFPAQLTFDPAEKRVQGRQLEVVMHADKPRVLIKINVNVSPSGGAVLFTPLYELFGTREDVFTNDHLDQLKSVENIEEAIANNQDLIADSQQAIASLRRELASLRAPNDIDEAAVVAATGRRLTNQISIEQGRVLNANSRIAQLRVILPAWPTLETMRRVHQRGRLSYRLFYVVGGREVDVLRGEGS